MKNMKRIVTLVLALVMVLSLMTVAGAKGLNEYSDAANVSAEYRLVVDFTTQLGVLQGMSENAYAPQGTLTRAQLATMIYRITTGDVAGKYVANYAAGARFDDVSTQHWAAGYINYCADAGFLQGVGNGLYAPNSTLTGYQALAALLRAIGYNRLGMFTGADWTVKVAEIAYQSGMTTGVFTNLNGPLTREQAAQLVFNALWANKVEYSAVFGYSSTGKTLAFSVFVITSPKAGESSLDAFGRSTVAWYTGTKVRAVIKEVPVASYANTAVDGCTLLKGLGYSERNTAAVTFDVYTNSASVTETYQLSHSGGAACTAKDQTFGGQGQQVEVYSVGTNHYRIVCVDTYLAKVTSITKAVYDAAGNLKTAAVTNLEVYDPAGTVLGTVSTEAYGKDTYLLVNYSATKGVEIVSTAKPVTVKGVYGVGGKTVAGGKTYKNANKFVLGKDAWDLSGTYDVYFDFYGNVIGVVEDTPVVSVATVQIKNLSWFYDNNTKQYILTDTYIDGVLAQVVVSSRVFSALTANTTYIMTFTDGVVTAAVPTVFYNYGIITDMAWLTSIGLASEYIAANLLTANNTVIPNVVIGNKWTNAGYADGVFNTSVSYNKAQNGAYYNRLVKFHVDGNGKCVVDAWGTELTNVTTNPAKGYIESEGLKYTVNARTVYLIKTVVDGKTVYTTYTGYANVPAMSKTTATFFADPNNAYIAYIYIDATAAIYEGTKDYVWFTKDLEVADRIGELQSGEKQFLGYIDGVATVITLNKADEAAVLADIDGAGLYMVTRSAAGYITSAAHWVADKTFVVKSAVGIVITDQDNMPYNCTGAVVYSASSSGALSVISEADWDTIVGKTAYCEIGADSVVDFIIVID